MKKHHVKAFARAVAVANGHDDPDKWAADVEAAYVPPEDEAAPAPPDPTPSVAQDLKASVAEAKQARADETEGG